MAKTNESLFSRLKQLENNEYKLTNRGIFISSRDCKCNNIIGKYKVFIDKVWNGSRLGYKSTIYVLNTETNEVRWNNIHYTLTEIVKILKDEIAKENIV